MACTRHFGAERERLLPGKQELSRYSQLYIERGLPASDSKRARVRLCALFSKMLSEEYQKEDIKSLIRVELGVKIALDGPLDFDDDFDEFFSKCEVRDLLDA